MLCTVGLLLLQFDDISHSVTTLQISRYLLVVREVYLAVPLSDCL
jgi:hypothetical protein